MAVGCLVVHVAAGVYCSGCVCTDCLNLPEHDEEVMKERNRAMQRCPHAFVSKVGGCLPGSGGGYGGQRVGGCGG
jgi:hypothetical protein